MDTSEVSGPLKAPTLMARRRSVCPGLIVLAASLFTFMMLMLVTADNLVQMFFGWEGVGLASYLLIGFWFQKPSANAAAIKAFVVNRVGDLGFMLGIFGTYLVFDTISIPDILAAAPGMAGSTIGFLGHRFDTMTVLCLLLFVGACGKSAQLGLHTWLPDAMEGPTPVSALIHAATMVTAGVYLVVRSAPIFNESADARLAVAVVGAVTLTNLNPPHSYTIQGEGKGGIAERATAVVEEEMGDLRVGDAAAGIAHGARRRGRQRPGRTGHVVRDSPRPERHDRRRRHRSRQPFRRDDVLFARERGRDQADPGLRAVHGARLPVREAEPPRPHGRLRRRRRGRR